MEPHLTEIIRPRALCAGDLIGVCAPAGPVEPEAVERGVAALVDLGFAVRVPDGMLARRTFTAGTIERRAAELAALWADEEVSGIVCARGGAGAAWLLPQLDPAALLRNPKVFVGYSDVTFLHLLLTGLGLVTFHGPMVARELAGGGYDRDSFLSAVTGVGAPYASGDEDLVPLRAGSAEGRLRGGCLSILAAAAGTPWALRADPEGTILFIEDVDERPYRIDRLIFQLRAAGALEGVAGIVLGDMKGCASRLRDEYSLEEVVLDALSGLDIPIALGLSSGHTSFPMITLPLGVRARLSCGDAARLEILEAAVT